MFCTQPARCRLQQFFVYSCISSFSLVLVCRIQITVTFQQKGKLYTYLAVEANRALFSLYFDHLSVFMLDYQETYQVHRQEQAGQTLKTSYHAREHRTLDMSVSYA